MDGLDEPSIWNFLNLKSHQILQPWSSLVATCPLEILCTTLVGHIMSFASHDQLCT